MILKIDRLRYVSLKMTHNELCFMCVQLQNSLQTTHRQRSAGNGPNGLSYDYYMLVQHKYILNTFEINSVFDLK